jgi:cytochrome c oxidase subunit 2
MSRRRRAERLGAERLGAERLAPTLLLAGCSPLPVLSGASEAARRTAQLGWLMLILAGIVFLIVLVVLALALRRNRRRDPAAVDLSEPGSRFVVTGGIVFPGLVLTGLFVYGTATLGFFPEREKPAYTVEVVGRQWWWEIRYLDPELPNRFVTANELHVPVGRPVRVLLTSADVIHSFWVPELQGKLDLIPGDTNVLSLKAERAGVYQGRCAEYCGLQHAHMGLQIVADEPAAFGRWLAAQREPAPAPTDSLAALGQQLFVSGPCALCHTVRGTPAHGSVAPDLTHFGSRRTIAAGALPNSLGPLEGWIANAQAIKPGALMPPITQFTGRELRAVAAYVAGLK